MGDIAGTDATRCVIAQKTHTNFEEKLHVAELQNSMTEVSRKHVAITCETLKNELFCHFRRL